MEETQMVDTLTPTHVHCYECDFDTKLEPGDDPFDTPCFECQERGEEDPYCVGAVAIIDCPNGGDDSCTDEDHDFGLHKHVVEIQR
jgi:hypothetical protein